MWERIAAMVFKEVRQMARDPGTVAMMLMFPIIQLVIFGIAINNDPRHLPLGIEANDHSQLTRSLVSALRQTSYFDVIELNEAFASQGLAVLRMLGVADDDARVNPNGGAIALGHPLGMSGARLVTTAMYQLQRTKGRFALCTMCIGVGQGIAIAIERV